MDDQAIDAQFHRAVDIVQSLPKGGPVQTSYEEKLGLYSLYKQATEGDIAIPRPGMLDMLGRAKWDSWHKQKGKRKAEAKRDYVSALMKILRKHSDWPDGSALVQELEAYMPKPSSSRHTIGDRPPSPSSSTSSYHSSAAPSPPASPPRRESPNYAPPDPNLPPPDVAADIIPPSALNASHKSLLSLSQAAQASGTSRMGQGAHTGSEGGYSGAVSGMAPFTQIPGSRTHSLAGGRAGSLEVPHRRKDSVHSLRNRPSKTASPAGLGFMPLAGGHAQSQGSHSFSRPLSPQITHRDYTPEFINSSPYIGLHQPTPTYPAHPGRMGGIGTPSTFSVPPINVPATLQQIQTSLAALHERMNTLERAQSMILRREERRRGGWFWGSTEEEELDQAEEEADRDQLGQQPRGGMIRTGTLRRSRGRWSVRVVWWLIGVVRRLMVDLSMGVFVGVMAVILVRGWRGQMGRRIRERLRRLLEPAPA